MKRLILLLSLLLITGCTRESASIGIIGGADGPTAILVSGPSAVWIVLPLAVILAIGIAIVKKRKH